MVTSQPNNKILSWLQMARETKGIRAFNNFCVSPWGLVCMGALTLLAYIFAIELYFYALVIAYVVYTCIFGEDFLPLVPICLLCYVSPSPTNNPGKSESSIFYGSHGGIILLCFAAVIVAALVFRLCTDKDIGVKKLFTQKRTLLFGFLALGLAYLLCGIGSAYYFKNIGRNILFSIIQFSAIFLFYFLFSATIKWEKVNYTYFAWVALILAWIVVGELAHVYLTRNVIVDKIIDGTVVGKNIMRERIFTGWGMYNNLGAMIAICIPFVIYLAATHRNGYIFLIVSFLLMVAVIFTGSRGSMLGAALALVTSFIVAMTKSKYRVMLLLTMAIVLGTAIVVALSLEGLSMLFSGVPSLIKLDKLPNIKSLWDLLNIFNDSNRFAIYREGLKDFYKNPVFGGSFYPSNFTPWDFSEVEKFSNFFPPRWHNTIIQILASCGAFGLCAYLFHRVQTILLFARKPSVIKSFIAISVLTLLVMSLLDCHMFNIGPAFFYSLALMFAEKLQPSAAEAEKSKK